MKPSDSDSTLRLTRSQLRFAALALVITLCTPLAIAQSSTRYVALLNGASAVPPSPSPALGTAVVYLNEPGNALVYSLTVTGALGALPISALLRTGAAGINGPAIAPLNGTGSGPWCGRLQLTAAQVTALKAGGLHFVVASATLPLPGGAIRGQILLNDPHAFVADLTGKQATPPNTSLATGHGSFWLNPDDSLGYLLRTSGLSGTSASIDVGSSLALSGGPTVWIGITPVLSPAARSIVRTGLAFVTVNTAAFPGGEIRGKVIAGNRPTPFGTGCPDPMGRIAEIAAERFPVIGNSYRSLLFGGAPGVPAILVHGFGLPTGIPIGGGCSLYLDPAPGFLMVIPYGTDANGCANYHVPIPYARGLLGASLASQWALFPPGGIRTSNALRVTIQ